MNESDTQSATPLKILFICGAGTVSGKEIATLNLIAGLRRRGHDVHCVTTTWGDGKFALRLAAQSVPHIRLPLGFISKTLSWSAAWMTLDQLRCVPRLWWGFRRYVRAFQPDVIVQSNFHHICLLWPLISARNTFFHVHDDFPKSSFYRRLFRFLNQRLCALICVSRFIADSMRELGVLPEKIHSVYNGVAIDESAAEGERVSGASPSEAARNPVVIGIIGQIGEWKGHDDFIAALAELKAAGVSASVMIFGEGHPQYVRALKEKIVNENLSEWIRFAGFAQDPREIYAAIDICVVPSRVAEAFGMVAAEAASFGIPVIATRLGGLAEIVRDGETGYLIDAATPQQLAAKLRLLIADAALRRRMGEAARRHALQHFAPHRMARQFEDVLIRSLQARSSAGEIVERAS